jgi:hypothetical protein
MAGSGVTFRAMATGMRTLRILAFLLAGYAALVLAGLLGPPLESLSGVLLVVPLLSIYLFHRLGIPGLLEHDGYCGWGWCSPTPFGWIFLAVFWAGVAWLLAWAIARLTLGRN